MGMLGRGVMGLVRHGHRDNGQHILGLLGHGHCNYAHALCWHSL